MIGAKPPLGYCFEPNARSYERHGEAKPLGDLRGCSPVPGRQQTSRALPPAHISGGFAPTGPEREGARHEAPPRSLLTCSAAASPDMASGDYNVHTGRQGEARKEKLS